MKDVAERAGVHQSSVSMALRNHPRIGKATRERILKIVEEMGYRPDPGLSALAAYRSSTKVKSDMGEIGLLTLSNIEAQKPDSINKLKYDGILKQAERYGYSITPFNLSDPKLTPKRLDQIIRARSIQGILIDRMQNPRSLFLRAMNWDKVTAVRMGRTPRWPTVTHVEHNQYSTMMLILRKLLLRGYRRIGLIHEWKNLKEINFFPEAAYNQMLNRASRSAPLPTFYFKKDNKAEIANWAEKHNMDAVISYRVPKVLFPTKKEEKRFLKKYGFVCLSLTQLDGEIAGVNQNIPTLGSRAVEVLVAQINRGERGFPDVASSILVEGDWIEGKSIRGPEGKAGIIPKQ